MGIMVPAPHVLAKLFPLFEDSCSTLIPTMAWAYLSHTIFAG